MPKKTDNNQSDLVEFARALGAKVHSTHMVAGGFPDVVVLWQGEIQLWEIKGPGGTLTPHQGLFHKEWEEARKLHIIRTKDDVVKALNGKL
jgi:hypothetical protein